MDKTQLKIQELSDKLDRLQANFNELSAQVNKNSFTSHQDFTKSCNFTTKLRIPSYTTLPTCEVGEIAESGGTLYICSATNTWTIVGTQN
jgi:hypothetical protein